MRTKKVNEDGRTSKWSKISILIILHKLFCRKFVQNLFKTNVNEHNHRCTGGYVLGASESISRPTSIQDRQQTYCNCIEIIEYFIVY